ncbi:uncharacterized protein BX664DRAFT_355762 [Halteromyces radiatus]|uniref:uncharacterized protein n=1 Tax=Halteromyces radiatus TaxID=101107 RepID=UPI00221E59DC|nr:uncharacterized protein BX664DRAFT_355762 [Halteromyces radiatus]KAI8096395.1 hypothetical protein BX664DRAFT_355762 [Halteromyces radiatus]
MNSVHDNNKKWLPPPVQSPSLTEAPTTPSQSLFPSTPMDHSGYTTNFSSGPLDSPIHQTFPQHGPSYFTPKHEPSDPRLPGMMGMSSQPSTPQPSSLDDHHDTALSPNPKRQRTTINYANAAFSTTGPYPHPSLIRKQRGSKSEPIFAAEMGPIFSSTKSLENIYALDRSTLLTARIQAKMDRGFFLADNDWTCYRRNYFQVSCAFTIPGLTNIPTPPPYFGADPHQQHPHHPHHHYHMQQDPLCYVQTDGMFLPIRQFSLNISARVSNSDKKIELVQHTPKRDKGPQNTPLAKPVLPGGNLSLSAVGASQNIATFERIQFKTATANNGKRRAAQQYYVCVVDLYCDTIVDGMHRQIKVASCQSAPLVVRGRSPGHYSDNNQLQQSQPSMMTSPSDLARFDSSHHPHSMNMSQQPSLSSHLDDHRFSPTSPSPYGRNNGLMVNTNNGSMTPGDYSYPSYPAYPNGGYPPFIQNGHPGNPSSIMMNNSPSSPMGLHPPPSHSSVTYDPSSQPSSHHHQQHHHHHHQQQQQQQSHPSQQHPYMVADMQDQQQQPQHQQQQQHHQQQQQQHDQHTNAASTTSSSDFYRGDISSPSNMGPPHPPAQDTGDWRRYPSGVPHTPTSSTSTTSSSGHVTTPSNGSMLSGPLPPLSTPNHSKSNNNTAPSTPSSGYDQPSYFHPPPPTPVTPTSSNQK